MKKMISKNENAFKHFVCVSTRCPCPCHQIHFLPVHRLHRLHRLPSHLNVCILPRLQSEINEDSKKTKKYQNLFDFIRQFGLCLLTGIVSVVELNSPEFESIGVCLRLRSNICFGCTLYFVPLFEPLSV